MVGSAIIFAEHETPARSTETLRDIAITAGIAFVGLVIAVLYSPAIVSPTSDIFQLAYFGIGANVFVVGGIVACCSAWGYITSSVEVVRISDLGVHQNGTNFSWDSVNRVEFYELPGVDNAAVFFFISRGFPRSSTMVSISTNRSDAREFRAAISKFLSDSSYNITLADWPNNQTL